MYAKLHANSYAITIQSDLPTGGSSGGSSGGSKRLLDVVGGSSRGGGRLVFLGLGVGGGREGAVVGGCEPEQPDAG